MEDAHGCAVGHVGQQLFAHERRVFQALVAIGAPSVAPLRRAVVSGKPEQQAAAVVTLGNLKLLAAEAAPDLAEAMEREELRERAAESLSRLGEAGVAGFIKALGSPQTETRLLAAERLAHFHERATSAVPALVRCVSDPSAELRKAAIDTLGRRGRGGSAFGHRTLWRMGCPGSIDQRNRSPPTKWAPLAKSIADTGFLPGNCTRCKARTVRSPQTTLNTPSRTPRIVPGSPSPEPSAGRPSRSFTRLPASSLDCPGQGV